MGTPSSTATHIKRGRRPHRPHGQEEDDQGERRQRRPADGRLVHERVEQDPDELDGEQHRRGLPPEPWKPAGHRRPVYGAGMPQSRALANSSNMGNSQAKPAAIESAYDVSPRRKCPQRGETSRRRDASPDHPAGEVDAWIRARHRGASSRIRRVPGRNAPARRRPSRRRWPAIPRSALLTIAVAVALVVGAFALAFGSGLTGSVAVVGGEPISSDPRRRSARATTRAAVRRSCWSSRSSGPWSGQACSGSRPGPGSVTSWRPQEGTAPGSTPSVRARS